MKAPFYLLLIDMLGKRGIYAGNKKSRLSAAAENHLLILKITLSKAAVNFDGLTTITFKADYPPRYLVQQIIPSNITATARTRTSHSTGRQIVITQPTPKASHKKSRLHIFFIVTTPLKSCSYFII